MLYSPAAESHAKQVALQVCKDEEKLAASRAKAVKAAQNVLRLQAEKQRLLVEEGHCKPQSDMCVPEAPSAPAGATVEQQKL